MSASGCPPVLSLVGRISEKKRSKHEVSLQTTWWPEGLGGSNWGRTAGSPPPAKSWTPQWLIAWSAATHYENKPWTCCLAVAKPIKGPEHFKESPSGSGFKRLAGTNHASEKKNDQVKRCKMSRKLITFTFRGAGGRDNIVNLNLQTVIAS